MTSRVGAPPNYSRRGGATRPGRDGLVEHELGKQVPVLPARHLEHPGTFPQAVLGDADPPGVAEIHLADVAGGRFHDRHTPRAPAAPAK